MFRRKYFFFEFWFFRRVNRPEPLKFGKKLVFPDVTGNTVNSHCKSVSVIYTHTILCNARKTPYKFSPRPLRVRSSAKVESRALRIAATTSLEDRSAKRYDRGENNDVIINARCGVGV